MAMNKMQARQCTHACMGAAEASFMLLAKQLEWTMGGTHVGAIESVHVNLASMSPVAPRSSGFASCAPGGERESSCRPSAHACMNAMNCPSS